MKSSRSILLCFLLACSLPLLADQAPTTEDKVAALKTLEDRAERGDPEAQFELAMLYFKGLGVEQDFNKGRLWLLTSANNGHTHAQLQLGIGFGAISKSREERLHWLRLAAAREGFHAEMAQQILADDLYNRPDQIEEALALYRKLGQARSPRSAAPALIKLARHYDGLPGDNNQKQAFDFYRQAADKGDHDAEFEAGMRYYEGKGTAQDRPAAVEYFRRTANGGLAHAQHNLGVLYRNGDGVDSDPAQAVAWYRKAADQDYGNSQLNLCRMYAEGQGVEKNPEHALTWCRKAAEKGIGDAQFQLGWMYETGTGIPRDDALAVAWYDKAAAQKHAEAAERLAALKRRLAAESAPGKVLEPKMIPLPAGQYLMGSPTDENDRSWWEPGPRTVKVAAFELAEHEVTFAEWDACVADGGCVHRPDDNGWGRGTRPVINVNLADIEQYLAWLNRKTGQRYRLPTDAEWEYAARAGTTTPFHTGACLSTEKANYKGYLAMKGCPEGQHREKTVPVKSFAANAWGFYDMHGNVAERTGECWLARDKPKAQPDCKIRAIRGGSWNYSENEARSGYLEPQPAELRYITIGFRLAR